MNYFQRNHTPLPHRQWSLLNFLLPQIFDDSDQFLKWFVMDASHPISSLTTSSTSENQHTPSPRIRFDFADNIRGNTSREDVVRAERESRIITSLHRVLKPFVLRRMKEDVCLTLPEKREIVVFANLSDRQREITQHILDGTLKLWLKENS